MPCALREAAGLRCRPVVGGTGAAVRALAAWRGSGSGSSTMLAVLGRRPHLPRAGWRRRRAPRGGSDRAALAGARRARSRADLDRPGAASRRRPADAGAGRGTWLGRVACRGRGIRGAIRLSAARPRHVADGILWPSATTGEPANVRRITLNGTPSTCWGDGADGSSACATAPVQSSTSRVLIRLRLLIREFRWPSPLGPEAAARTSACCCACWRPCRASDGRREAPSSGKMGAAWKPALQLVVSGGRGSTRAAWLQESGREQSVDGGLKGSEECRGGRQCSPRSNSGRGLGARMISRDASSRWMKNRCEADVVRRAGHLSAGL